MRLFNSKTKSIEEFKPINVNNIRMYVCGPTVYDRPHLGNVRAAVVYDILYRILQYLYPGRVTYARNITDVDDKIIDIARKNNINISDLTIKVTQYYHQDLEALGCLKPNVEPKATEHIKEMIDMIQSLIKNNYAYVSEGHVLFAVENYEHYGKLSNRSLEEMIAGSRVEIAPYKKNPMDFILWKPIKPGEEDASFQNPWNDGGRPGWHIECAAMTKKHLGETFDIHGGGIDLIFPHHENELAQSACANQNPQFAKYWVHNGFLTVEGEKMSKSLGNFFTAHDIIEQGTSGEALRYFYMTSHYRKPLDFNRKAIHDAQKAIEKFRVITENIKVPDNYPLPPEVIEALMDDMNTTLVLSILHRYLNLAHKGNKDAAINLCATYKFLGLNIEIEPKKTIPAYIIELAEKRMQAKLEKNWILADQLRIQIQEAKYSIQDTGDGYHIIHMI